MNKHTFKVGDRVFGRKYVSAKGMPGVFVKKDRGTPSGCIVRRDDGVSGIEPGLYWYADDLTTHDTDFQVGDWVRYEALDKYATQEEGKIGQVKGISRTTSLGILWEGGWRCWSHAEHYLVKIQPPQVIIKNCVSYNNKPQETQVETVKIKHEKYGVVEGVECYPHWQTSWCKNGAIYRQPDGWSQVPEVEWVTIRVEKGDWDKVDSDGGVFMSRTAGRYHFGVTWRYPQ